MTAREYALAQGWDFSHIKATAVKGVSPYDVEALATTDLPPSDLLAYCVERAQDAD